VAVAVTVDVMELETRRAVAVLTARTSIASLTEEAWNCDVSAEKSNVPKLSVTGWTGGARRK